MKKLMFAAAVAAMVCGAQADVALKNYIQLTDEDGRLVTTSFEENQLVVIKRGASAYKTVSLDTADLGKAVKYRNEAVDGVFYYDIDESGTNGIWKAFSWSKDPELCKEDAVELYAGYLGGVKNPETGVYTFNYPVFVNDNTTETSVKKAIAGINWKKDEGLVTESAEAYAYAPLSVSYSTVRVMLDDKTIVSKKKLNLGQVKSVKNSDGNIEFKASVKTYGNKAARDRALKAYWDKYLKAKGN